MSEVEQFLGLLRDQQNPEKEKREASEAFMLAAAHNNPESFVTMCFHVIENAAVEKASRIAAAIVLKKTLYPSQGEAIYRKLSPAAREAFRRNVLILLARIDESGVKSLVADLIGSVAAAVLGDEQLGGAAEQRWPDLLPHLAELFASQGTPANVSAVFAVLDRLFTCAMSTLAPNLPKIVKLFADGFTIHPPTCKMDALRVFVTLLQAIKRKDLRQIRPLKAPIIAFMAELGQPGNEEQLENAMGLLVDITETEPSFFKPEIDALLALAERVWALDSEDTALRMQAIDVLMPLFEGFPELFSQAPTRLDRFFALVVRNMLAIEEEVTDEWKSPPDGFNDELEEDDDQQPIKFSIDIVNRLFDVVGPEKMLRFLSAQITPMMQSADWRQRHAAVMVLSQAGEYMANDMGQVSAVLALVAQNAKDANPRLRYACCHLLGQFADDLPIKFQESFHRLYFEVTLPLLQDPVPRVVAHCLASLTNFLENSTKEQIAPHFQLLYSQIVGWLNGGICFVREAALSAISALCEGAPELFEPTLDPLMEIIFGILRNANAAVFKVLKGNAVECATILAKYAKRERFEKYATPLIVEMIATVQSGVSYEGVDPQKSFLLSGFQRLAIVVPDKLAPHLDQIMASLVQMAGGSLAEGASGISARTALGEETELALQMMSSFIQNMPTHMGRYAEQIYALMNIVIEQSFDPEVRVSALEVLGMLAKLHRGQPTPASQQVLRKTVEKIWAMIESEEEGETIADELNVLEKVLKHAEKCFSESELLQLYAKCKAELKRSLERKATLADDIDEEDEVENAHCAQKEREQLEEDLQVQVANVIGAMFRSHGATALPVFTLALTELINPALASPRGACFAVYLIDEAIEHLNAGIPQQTLVYFLGVLARHCTHREVCVRQASVFGLGIAAQVLGEAFESPFPECYKAVESALNGPLPADDETEPTPRELRALRDNCYSTQGKMFSALWAKLNDAQLDSLLGRWIEGLPMLEDHKENILNMKLVFWILKAKPHILLGADFGRLAKLLSIFSQVYHQKKVSNAQLDAEIKQWTQQLVADERMKAVVVALPLEDKVKEFLNSIVTSA